MDYIKKIVCLEDARTRTQGIMPYYEVGATYPDVSSSSYHTMSELGLTEASGSNGNWGQFVANPEFLANHGKIYNTMLNNYYQLLNMVRDGIKLRKVTPKNSETIFTEDTDAFWINGQCFSGGTEPNIYDYAAYDADKFYTANIESLREETRTVYRYDGDVEEVNYDYVVLIANYEKFTKISRYLNGVSIPESLSAETIGNDEHTMWSEYCSVVDACIGRINIPASIYNNHIKAPKSMSCADVSGYITWLKDNENLSGNCCNARLWDDMGGEDMLVFLEASAETKCEDYRKAVNELKYSVPYLEMPLLLIQNFTDVGVLTNIDGVEYDATLSGQSAQEGEETRPHGYLQLSSNDSGFTLPDGREEISGITVSGLCLTIDQIIMENIRKSYPIDDVSGVVVESLLKTLAGNKKYTDDNDNILPGLFSTYSDSPGGKYFQCVKNGDEWVTSLCSGDDLTNGDGMSSEEIANADGPEKFYRTVTTESAAKRISEVYDEEPKEPDAPTVTAFYFKVKYENSESKPMTLPYKSGNTTNVYFIESGETESDPYVYRGDFIAESPIINGNEIEIKYVVGGRYSADSAGNFIEYIGSGDVYYEKHTYDPKHLIYATLDGVDNVPIYTQYIDFETDAKEFYSPVYNLYRTGNTANIISATTGEFWNSDFSYDAYLTKEEYLTNFSLPPKVDVNVTIDRGGVSAFEKHYKLGECNTMQDLMQYGNNYFNL